MGDGSKKLEVISDYFETASSELDSPQRRNSSTSTSGVDSPPHGSSLISHPSTGQSGSWARLKSKSASFMLKLFSLKGLPFTGADDEEKVELSAVELESLRSELADVEEREAHLKAQLEHLDEILRWARLSGYLYIRTRWTALPGEPPTVDDCEVDDWLPRFLVLQGPCIFFYQSSTDLSPQDSTLLTDIVEVGPLPSLIREDEATRHCFYILTRYGLRFECSSISKIQVESWLKALQMDCKLGPEKAAPCDQSCDSNLLHCTQLNPK
ncbi:hypothetical protein Nepgr_030682 [Nepenthes gracilis]|uniref:PH domain-containing protein n=1 Tax=Nepenthes gracilis TaxID=150966 RepID=A0AAD3TGP0_NEPGR|nr:hypothetical protein Nepgr_030682 [Nepenthes gracilis]